MADCACDAFTAGYLPSADAGARPQTWRPLSEDLEARFSSSLDCHRGKDLVLAFCLACRRRWYLCWDQQNDTYAAVPVEPELLAVLNLTTTPRRLAKYFVTPSYRWWGHALGDFVDRYLWEASYDTAEALQLFEAAQKVPGLAPQVVSSLEVRIERVKRKQLEERHQRRKSRRAPPLGGE